MQKVFANQCLLHLGQITFFDIFGSFLSSFLKPFEKKLICTAKISPSSKLF